MHILNSFWETALKFSLVMFWYIILGFLQYFPEFFFRIRLSFISFSFQVIPYCLYNIQVWTLWRLCVFSAKFDSGTGISSVLGIIVILKNKTVPNQTLSWRNGMMGLFSSHTVFFYLSHVRRRVEERWNNECLPVLLGILSQLLGSRMLKSTDRFKFIMPFLFGPSPKWQNIKPLRVWTTNLWSEN